MPPNNNFLLQGRAGGHPPKKGGAGGANHTPQLGGQRRKERRGRRKTRPTTTRRPPPKRTRHNDSTPHQRRTAPAEERPKIRNVALVPTRATAGRFIAVKVQTHLNHLLSMMKEYNTNIKITLENIKISLEKNAKNHNRPKRGRHTRSRATPPFFPFLFLFLPAVKEAAFLFF